MDEAARARTAFRDGIADIGPEALRERLEGVLAAASMTPGALTVCTAATLGESVGPDAAAQRGASLQMTYEGLALSRELIDADPWTNGDRSNGDMNAIAAEVLVARGFERLAATAVAADVVEAVRRFGRDQTRREDPEADRAALDRGLETDFIRIAVVAGADLALGSVPEGIGPFADALAGELRTDPLSPPDVALDGLEERVLAAAGPDATTAGDLP